jgi:aldehyde:ferredoxin oxidoreductase
MDPEHIPMTSEIFHEIARLFWGSVEAGYLSTYEGKALAAVKIQNRTYTEDCLGLCDFAWPLTFSFSKPDRIGDPDLEAKIFTAVTGGSSEVIDRCVERMVKSPRTTSLPKPTSRNRCHPCRR